MRITNIKRFAVHDGDGIRTTIFLKGCPLKCIWCHNPETIRAEKQLAFYAHKCTNCGKCAEICVCHTIGTVHKFNRESCIVCGKCTVVCPNDALEIFGEDKSVDEIYDLLLRDKSFYDESGGGVTLSGGECLLQADECGNLLRKLHTVGINTAVDTCGFVPQSAIDKVIPYTDTFLYDIKAFDEDVHIKCTGASNKLILENLRYIDKRGIPIEIRIPYIPDYNDNQIEKIGKFISELKHITAVRILPYHNYAASEYTALGSENTLPKNLPEAEQINSAAELLRRYSINVK